MKFRSISTFNHDCTWQQQVIHAVFSRVFLLRSVVVFADATEEERARPDSWWVAQAEAVTELAL